MGTKLRQTQRRRLGDESEVAVTVVAAGVWTPTPLYRQDIVWTPTGHWWTTVGAKYTMCSPPTLHSGLYRSVSVLLLFGVADILFSKMNLFELKIL